MMMVVAFTAIALVCAQLQNMCWARPGGCDLAICGLTCNDSFKCLLPTIQAAVNALGPGGGQVSLYAGTYQGAGNSDIRLANGQYTIKYACNSMTCTRMRTTAHAHVHMHTTLNNVCGFQCGAGHSVSDN